MKNNYIATYEGGPNIGVAELPQKQNGKDETAATVSPMNDNPAGEHGLIERAEDNSSTKTVDTETVTLIRRRLDDEPNATEKTTTPTTGENPGSDQDAAEAELNEPQNKTAAELMREHVGEIPKAEKKFSLASLKSKSEEAAPKSNTRPGTIAVGKPNDDTFIRTSVKPPEWAAFDFIELKTEKRLYLLTPDVVEEIIALNEDRAQVMIKTVKKRLIYSVTRQGDPFLWPITIMDGDNDWIDSANICAEAAKENWVRVVSNVPAGRYDYVISPSPTEPEWSALTYEEAVLKAFGGKIIDSFGHDVILQLLGED